MIILSLCISSIFSYQYQGQNYDSLFTNAQYNTYSTDKYTQLKTQLSTGYQQVFSFFQRYEQLKYGFAFDCRPQRRVSTLKNIKLALADQFFTQDRLDKFRHLIVGISIASQDISQKNTDYENWIFIQNGRFGQQRIVQQIRDKSIPRDQICSKQGQLLALVNLDMNSIPDRFWANICGYAYHNTPQVTIHQSNLFNLKNLITRYQGPGIKTTPKWPAYNDQIINHPIGAYLMNSMIQSEIDWIWQSYFGANGMTQGMVGYAGPRGFYCQFKSCAQACNNQDGRYFDHIHRIWDRSGKCQRLARMGQFFRKTLGVPATGMLQPRHRGFVTFTQQTGGITGVALQQSVSTYLQSYIDLNVYHFSPATKRGSPFSMLTLAGSQNLGYKRRVANRILVTKYLQSNDAAEIDLAISVNPLDIDSWYYNLLSTSSRGLITKQYYNKFISYIKFPNTASVKARQTLDFATVYKSGALTDRTDQIRAFWQNPNQDLFALLMREINSKNEFSVTIPLNKALWQQQIKQPFAYFGSQLQNCKFRQQKLSQCVNLMKGTIPFNVVKPTAFWTKAYNKYVQGVKFAFDTYIPQFNFKYHYGLVQYMNTIVQDNLTAQQKVFLSNIGKYSCAQLKSIKATFRIKKDITVLCTPYGTY